MFRFAERGIGAAGLAVILLVQGAGIGAIQTWSDGGFGGWSFTSVASPGSSVSVTIAGGCNPGSGLNCTTSTGETAWAICMNPDATWYPSLRPIESVSMSIDVKSMTGWGQGQAIRIVALQSEKMYFAPSFSETCITSSQTVWHRISIRSCVQGDFFELTGPFSYNADSHPDFSQTGSRVEFGFMLGNRISGTYTQLYDNVEFEMKWRYPLIQYAYVLNGVPGYTQWEYTCGPTSAGMVIGYWDQQFPALVPGSANTQTDEVNSMIIQIMELAFTTPLGTLQAMLAYAMDVYSSGHGVPAVVGLPLLGLSEADIVREINRGRPLVMFSHYGAGDHIVVVDGYAILIDLNTDTIALTDLHLIDPSNAKRKWDNGNNGTSEPSYIALWANRSQWLYPVKGFITYHPQGMVTSSPVQIVLGGSFNSPEELGLFEISGDGSATLTGTSPIPLPDENQRLVMTTASEPMLLSQEGMFGSGKGFDLEFEYALSAGGILEILLDGISVWTVQGTPPPSNGILQHFIDTPSMGLDPQAKHRLTLKLTGPANSVLWLDNLTATLRPYPDPLDKADLDGNGWIDLADLAELGLRWSESGCVDPDFCGGADLTGDGQVGLEDLLLFSEAWLTSAGQL
jgi:hypothetical protein